MPNILYIAPFFFTSGTSEAVVNAKLVTAGLAAGWRVDVVAERQQYTACFPDDDTFRRALSNVTSLLRAPTPGSLRHLLLRIESQLIFRGIHALYRNAWGVLALRKASELLRTNKYDIIMSRALPVSAHLPALFLARKSGIPWIANWNDPTPLFRAPPPYGKGPFEQPPGGGLWSGLSDHSLQRFLRTVASEAAWHTFPCERLRKYMGIILGESIYEKSSVIPHIALDLGGNEPVRPADTFSMCYAGGLQNRDPRVFLQGVRLFLDAVKPQDRISVVFVCEHGDTVKEYAGALSLENIIHIEPSVPYRVAVQRLGQASVALIIEAQMQEGIFFPAKFVDCAQTGRPILAVSPLNGTIADLIGKNGGGIVADCFSPASVAAAIASLHSSWKLGTLDQEYGSKRLLAQFSVAHIMDLYDQLFRTLMSHRPACAG